jgi:hypothetical protein
MAPAVAEVLKLRAEGWSRPEVVGNISKNLEAAFKWVDRNRDAIAQVLSLETPPAEDVKGIGSKNRRAKFIPPAEALKAVIAKHQTQVAIAKAGPSIEGDGARRLLSSEERHIETPAERILRERREAWIRGRWARELATSFGMPTDAFDVRLDGKYLYVALRGQEDWVRFNAQKFLP